jgi:hypothetical protein
MNPKNAVGGILLTIIAVWPMSGILTAFDPLTGSNATLRKSDDPAAMLVEQLGAPEFADREAAEKRLLGLGTKAKPTLKVGLKSESPEVRQRSSRILAVVRRDQLWAAFTKVAGDTKDAQELFSKMMSSQRASNAIEVVLDDPTQTEEAYLTRTAELMRIAYGHPPVDENGKAGVPTEPDVWAPPAVPLGDIAGWLFLGAVQTGKAEWRCVTLDGWRDRLSSHVAFLPEDDYSSAQPIAAAYSAANSTPLKKLTVAWLEKRRENDTLRAGITLAIRYDITDGVAAVRIVLNTPNTKKIDPQNLAACLVLLGLNGTKDDLPLLARHTTDDRRYVTFLNLPPRQARDDLAFSFRTPAEDGRDLFCHVRDAAVVSMCKLAGKDPADIGFPPFPPTKHPKGGPMSLSMSTSIGFKAKADRAKAFEKAAAWIKSNEPPATPNR